MPLLNNEFVLLQARYLAERVMRDAGRDSAARVRLLYRITLSRQPTEKELAGDLEFLKKEQELQASKPADASAEERALASLAHVMLNTNEFVYVN
jgi:hypothetical protein